MHPDGDRGGQLHGFDDDGPRVREGRRDVGGDPRPGEGLPSAAAAYRRVDRRERGAVEVFPSVARGDAAGLLGGRPAGRAVAGDGPGTQGGGRDNRGDRGDPRVSAVRVGQWHGPSGGRPRGYVCRRGRAPSPRAVPRRDGRGLRIDRGLCGVPGRAVEAVAGDAGLVLDLGQRVFRLQDLGERGMARSRSSESGRGSRGQSERPAVRSAGGSAGRSRGGVRLRTGGWHGGDAVSHRRGEGRCRLDGMCRRI